MKNSGREKSGLGDRCRNAGNFGSRRTADPPGHPGKNPPCSDSGAGGGDGGPEHRAGCPRIVFFFTAFSPPNPRPGKNCWKSSGKDPRPLSSTNPPAAPALLKEARKFLGTGRRRWPGRSPKSSKRPCAGLWPMFRKRSGGKRSRGGHGYSGGKFGAGSRDPPAIREALRECLENSGVSWKEAIERVAEELGVAKREVYRESLKIKKKWKGTNKNPCSPEGQVPGKQGGILLFALLLHGFFAADDVVGFNAAADSSTVTASRTPRTHSRRRLWFFLCGGLLRRRLLGRFYRHRPSPPFRFIFF